MTLENRYAKRAIKKLSALRRAVAFSDELSDREFDQTLAEQAMTNAYVKRAVAN